MYLPSPLNETVNEKFFKKAVHKNVQCPLHIHYHLEIVYVTDGVLIMQVGSETRIIKKGFATLIWPFESHSFETPDQSTCLVLEFSPLLVGEFFEIIKEKQLKESVFAIEEAEFHHCLQLGNGIIDSAFVAKSVLYPLCMTVYSKCEFLDGGRVLNDVFIAAVSHIARNFKDEGLSLTSTAKAIAVHSVYLSRLFAQNAEVSFCKYLAMTRCIYAANLLLNEPDKTISEVALSCGFGSIRSFNRQFFDLFKTTPTEYKNQSKK